MINEAVKGEDTQRRKDDAAERRSGEVGGVKTPKRLAPSKGRQYVKGTKASIDWWKNRKKINEVAPPGFGHTKSGKGDEKGGTAAAFDRARKEGRFKGSKSDMFAIMWSQKNKGDKPHYKPGTDKKYKKYQEEDAKYGYDKKGRSLNPKDIKKRSKDSAIPSRNDHDNKPAIEDWVSNHSMQATESFVLEREDSPYEKASDKALDKKYGYGTSHDKGPKTGFGRASNRATAAAVLKDIRRRRSKSTSATRADAAHKGWSHTARTSADQTPEKKATRKKLADIPYKKLPKDEQEKDQVAADAVKKEYDKRKKINESLSVKDSKKLAKASVLSTSDNPKDQDRARARQVEVDYKDLMKQRKSGKVGVGKSMRTEGKSWKQWKQAAKDAVGRKTPKHDYGKDAGAEAAKRLRKKDHEKVNFLDPED